MYQIQMQFLGLMAETGRAYAQTYAAVLDAQSQVLGNMTGTSNDFSGGKPGQSGKASGMAAMFDLLDLPTSGRSWYRAPYENPFLAQWDQFLRLWQPMFVGAASGQNPFSGTLAAMPFWEAWGKMASSLSSPNSLWAGPLSVYSMPMNMTAFGNAARFPAAWPAAWTTGMGNANLNLAKIWFPDKTEVAFSIPMMPGVFGR